MIKYVVKIKEKNIKQMGLKQKPKNKKPLRAAFLFFFLLSSRRTKL